MLIPTKFQLYIFSHYNCEGRIQGRSFQMWSMEAGDLPAWNRWEKWMCSRRCQFSKGVTSASYFYECSDDYSL